MFIYVSIHCMSDSDITAVLQKLSDNIDTVKDGQADIMKRWVDLESQTGADINNESEDDINKKEHENNCDKEVNSKESHEKSGSESEEEYVMEDTAMDDSVLNNEGLGSILCHF